MSLTLYKRNPPRDVRQISAIVREQRQWEKILDGLTSQEAAARIFGDLMCYTATRKQNGYDQPRDHFYDDVDQLARALDAYATIHKPKTD